MISAEALVYCVPVCVSGLVKMVGMQQQISANKVRYMFVCEIPDQNRHIPEEAANNTACSIIFLIKIVYRILG